MYDLIKEEAKEIVNELKGVNSLSNSQANKLLEFYCKNKNLKFEKIFMLDKYEYSNAKVFPYINNLCELNGYVSTTGSRLNFINSCEYILGKLFILESLSIYGTGNMSKYLTCFKLYKGVNELDLSDTQRDLYNYFNDKHIKRIIASKIIKFATIIKRDDYLCRCLFINNPKECGSCMSNFAINVFKNDIVNFILNEYNIEDESFEQVIKEVVLEYIETMHKFDLTGGTLHSKSYLVNGLVRRTFKIYISGIVKSYKEIPKIMRAIPDDFKTYSDKLEVDVLNLEKALLKNLNIKDYYNFTSVQLDIVNELLNNR